MSRPSRVVPVAGLVLLFGSLLSGCSGGEDADAEPSAETVAADTAACRAITLADARLQGARESAQRGGATPEDLIDYEVAISTVTGAVVETDVSSRVADATVGLVSRWSRTRSYLAGDVAADSFNPDSYANRFEADGLALAAVEAVCPGSNPAPED